MKAIRRSLKTDKEKDPRGHTSQPSLHSKTATAIIPPKKVIKALYDYEPTNKNGQELAFRKGDFFHVLSREDDTEWYEACNPLIPSARGLVPVAYFDVIGKQQQQQRQSDHSIRLNDAHDSGFSEKGTTAANEQPDATATTPRAAMHSHTRGPSHAKANPMVYGIVLYDFQAERLDELEAKKGEPIIVVAQSNPEWFVAKPIGRLGGPGLIPVSFVAIKDTVTGKTVDDPLTAVRSAGVPRVEEWKKTAAEYKNSSISLGQVTTPHASTASIQSNTNGMIDGMDRMSLQNQRQPVQAQRMSPQHRIPLYPIQASVPRYCFDNDMYWYIIEAQMEDGRWWELSRYYADFYDFQIALLNEFPKEAGQDPSYTRTLPYMPGPVAHVTDAISNGRRESLDQYIKKIIAMPHHISRSRLVRKLFEPKPGQDYEIDPNALGDDFRLSGQSLAPSHSRQSTASNNQPSASAYTSNVPLPNQSMTNISSHRSSPSNSLPYPPRLHTQASNLTTDSVSSSQRGLPSASASTQPVASALRIKVEFESETYAIRVPQDVSFEALKEKVAERLRVREGVDIAMKYRDDQAGTTAPLTSDEELDEAIKRNANLRLVVSYA